MERLTKKVDGVWTASCEYGRPPYPVVTQEVIDRLAAYEDTGLAPEEIQIQKEAMESMGWFGKMFQRYKGDPRGPIGTLGTTLGKSLVVLNVESAKNRQPVKDVDGNTWLPMLLDEFESMADVIEHGQEWIPVKVRLRQTHPRRRGCTMGKKTIPTLCIPVCTGTAYGYWMRTHRQKWTLLNGRIIQRL